MSQSFIQPFYGIETKTHANLFGGCRATRLNTGITADHGIVKMWPARSKPKPGHPVWNGITHFDDSTVVFCYGDTVFARDLSNETLIASCSFPGNVLVDMERHHENKTFLLVRSAKGQVHILRTNDDMKHSNLVHIDSVERDPLTQMALDGTGSFYCIGDSDLLSVFDMTNPTIPIFSLKRQSAGPVAFAPSTQPNVIYQGFRTYLGVVDLRESSEVSRILPNPAQITLTSYSTLLKYSCLSVNPCRDTEIAAFSQQHQALQVFDSRSVRSPVFEWALSGREYRTEDRLPPPPIRHIEYSSDGSRILINRPMSFSSYVVSLVPSNSPDAASYFVEVPVCPDMDSQIDDINARRKAALEAKYPPHRSQKTAREFNAMKFLTRNVNNAWIEFSLGACFVGPRPDILSVSSMGNLFTVSQPTSESAPERSQRPPSHIPRTVGVSRIFPPEVQFISPEHVDLILARLNRKFRPRALYPRPVRELSNRDKFFLYCITKIVPHLPSCLHHRGSEKSSPGSFVWNMCVDTCGYRRPSHPPSDPVGTTYVTTVRQIQFAYNEMYGMHLHAKTIVDFFQDFFGKPKSARRQVNPNVYIQWYPGDSNGVPVNNPILFESLDCPAVIVIVKVSSFGSSLRTKSRKIKPRAPSVDQDMGGPIISSSSSDDDDDDLFSQKRPRITGPSSNTVIAQKKASLVVTDITPLAGDVLKNRYITMQLVDDLRARWAAPDYDVKYITKRKPKTRAVVSNEEVNDDTVEEDEQGDDEEDEAVSSTPPEPLVNVRLSELLRGGPLKPR